MKRKTLVQMHKEMSKTEVDTNDDYFTPALKVFDEQIQQQKQCVYKNKHLCDVVMLKRLQNCFDTL